MLATSAVSNGFSTRHVATEKANTKSAAFFLAGDSTTAPNGGWGDGFIPFLAKPFTGINNGQSGATTVSFVHGGDWAIVIGEVKKYAADYDCFVTIQFGHNDQKEASGITVAEYQTNLQNMADQVKAAGGTPVGPLSGNTGVVELTRNRSL